MGSELAPSQALLPRVPLAREEFPKPAARSTSRQLRELSSGPSFRLRRRGRNGSPGSHSEPESEARALLRNLLMCTPHVVQWNHSQAAERLISNGLDRDITDRHIGFVHNDEK